MQRSFLTMMAALASVPVAPSLAHHSYAMFDQKTDVSLAGTVKEVQWTNPHIWIQVLAKDAAGQEVEWSIEGGSPNILTRSGWTRNALKAGDQVTLVIHPKKSGKGNPHVGSLVSAVANGERHFDGPDRGEVGKGPANEGPAGENK